MQEKAAQFADTFAHLGRASVPEFLSDVLGLNTADPFLVIGVLHLGGFTESFSVLPPSEIRARGWAPSAKGISSA